MLRMLITACIILLNSRLAWADISNITVVGLFSDVAVVKIDNEQHILRVGKASPEGVKLVSASSRSAILEVNGVQEEYSLGGQVGSRFTPPPRQPTVSLWRILGMYTTPGSINGYSVGFLVDTGASTIALNGKTAKRLDLDYKSGDVVRVKTASGVEQAYKINLDEVQVGEIKLQNVAAMVLEGEQPEQALLGMSFLGQLDISHDGERMDLKQKYQ